MRTGPSYFDNNSSRLKAFATVPLMTSRQPSLVLGLDGLDRAAGLPPGGEASLDMGDGGEAHMLRRLGGERRTPGGGTVEDEGLVFLEHRLGIGAFRVDPELQHATRTGEGTRDLAVARQFARIA